MSSGVGTDHLVKRYGSVTAVDGADPRGLTLERVIPIICAVPVRRLGEQRQMVTAHNFSDGAVFLLTK